MIARNKFKTVRTPTRKHPLMALTHYQAYLHNTSINSNKLAIKVCISAGY
jgi:hypothetical protein